MKKKFISILLTLVMALILLPTASVRAESTSMAHGKLADGGYNIYCLAGRYVTVDTYPSLRSVELGFSEGNRKVFYVENKGDNQITLKVEDPYKASGYSYIGIDSTIKDGTALKLVDRPYLWTTYDEHNTATIFSLRPSTNYKMFAGASGGKNEPRTKIILWTNINSDAKQYGEFRFEPVADSVKTPVTSDYSFTNLSQTEGSVTAVKIERDGKSSPGAITILYDGSIDLPSKAGSYSVTFNVAAELPAWNEAVGLSAGKLVIAPKQSNDKRIGQAIVMGGMKWRVLDVQDGKALLISDKILENRPYYKSAKQMNDWADSSLRSYLNGDFYKKSFSKNEKGRIVSTTLVNNINPDYSNTLGKDTKDKIFLLSIEDVNRYFKDIESRIAYADRRSPALLHSTINNITYNPYSDVYQNYTAWGWWLRTPAQNDKGGAIGIDLLGKEKTLSNTNEYGVRPAMWIKLEGGGFKKYQALTFKKKPKYFTMEDMVLAISRDIVYEHIGDWVYKFGYGARGPGVSAAEKSDDTIPPGYYYTAYVFRMRCWGVLSTKEFDPYAKVNYGQFKDYLKKTMEWNRKYGAGGSNSFKLTDKVLAIAEKRARISDTGAKAKPVKKEIERLCQEILYWLDAANYVNTTHARIMDMPSKTDYKVGDKYDITGLRVVTGPYGKEKNVNKKLSFTISGEKLTPGHPFQTTGQKSITVSYGNQTLMTYPVTVK